MNQITKFRVVLCFSTYFSFFVSGGVNYDTWNTLRLGFIRAHSFASLYKRERKAPALRLWLLPLQCLVIAGMLPDVQPHHAAICCHGSKNPESFLRCKPFEAAGGSPTGFIAPLLFVQVRLMKWCSAEERCFCYFMPCFPFLDHFGLLSP